ncbi:MAG: PAS domain S-box protein [Thermodesulfobacteriota bacterium]
MAKSDEQHRLFFENTTIGIIYYSKDGVITDANEAVCKIFGSSADQLIGLSTADVPDKEFAREILRSLQGEKGHYKGRYVSHTGKKEVFIRAEWVPILEEGRVVSGVGIIEDYTGRQKAEDALKESERKYRLLAENSPDMIYRMFIPEGRYDYVSPSSAEIIGYSPRECYDTPLLISEIIHPDWREYFDLHWERLKQGKAPATYDYQVIHKDGSERWLNQRNIIENGEDGLPIAIVGLVTDVTARRQLENALRESEERFRTLFDAAQDGILMADAEGKRFIDANPAMCKMLGYNVEELTYLGITDIHPPEIVSYILGQFARLARQEISVLHDLPILRKDGSVFYADIANSLLTVGGQPCVAGFYRDITSKKDIEQQLSQAQKMEAIGTLAGGIAHDFNNILGAMLGYAEMAKDQTEEGSGLHEDMEQILVAGTRAKNLVDQILAFSRQTESEQIPLQFQLLLKETVKLLRSSIPTTITIEENIDGECGMIRANPTQLHQVVMNLCTNGYHAMEEKGGTLSVSLSRENLDSGDLRDEISLKPGPYVRLSVRDTGPGIDPAIIHQIFNPYFTTKEVGKGTGLGLSVVDGIVKSHGGMIRFASQWQEGTVFHIYFPEAMDTSEENLEAEEDVLTGHERILFVDDEEILVDMATQLLERFGYRVTAYTDSLEALRMFKEEPDQFDMLITDQTMPGITGADLAREIFTVRPGFPVILTTGYSSVISEEEALALGISGYLMKPILKNDILPLIQRILSSKEEI